MTYKNVFIIFSFLWNFITGLTSILGYFKIESDFMVELFNGLTSKELAEYTLLVFAIISLCFATGFALILLSQFFNKENKKPSKEELFFKDVINNMRDPNSIKWSYKNHHNLDMSGIPLYETWEKWLKDLINHMDVQNIDYPNFGDHYYFYEMTSGKEINIPIGVEDTRNKKVRDSFKNGMVLRLMPRET